MNGFSGLVRIFSRIEKKLIELVDILNLLFSFLRGRGSISDITWLDNQDVMLILKISERTLRRHRLNGRIPFYRFEGKFYYKAADIDIMLGSSGKRIG